MNIMELGAIGELVGGVAVLATLVYLALQVRQGNRVARAQVHQESARMSSELLVQMDPKSLDVFTKAASDPESLTESDRLFLRIQFVAVVNYYETLFYAWERGEVDPDLWESRRYRIVGFVGIQTGIFWTAVKMGFGSRFRAFVDELLATEESVPWLLPEVQ